MSGTLSAALAHLRDFRIARTASAEVLAQAGALQVDLARVLAFRSRATHLDQRLPAGSHVEAARGGLQDTVPRAALAALHARVERVEPDSWEVPDLCQVWFRWADYVVPRQDFAVFTLGALPRAADRAQALRVVASAVCELLQGRPLSSREVRAGLPAVLSRAGHDHAPEAGILLRAACVSGRYLIRWDARTVTVIPTGPPDMDAEDARRELATRFLGWHGPASAAQFARWAGMAREDAAETWTGLARELIPVSLEGRARELLARDEEALTRAEPAFGVRLLPMGDPYLALDRNLFDAPGAFPPPTEDDRGQPVTSRLVNSLGGRVLVDGRIVGSWGRHQHHLSIHLWDPGERERVRAEAETFAGPIGRPMTLSWLS
ncbi:MAG: winged helix DNA-binding domain-containing protein [Candidatus Dormibacteraeota bacterium]|nr:winged helix DNA-binding domain-containing protein [Candidatus Dormibacteraeota bacterium]